MRLSSKAAIQLSMNFLVTIIIALVLLAAGILLLRQFVDVSVNTQDDIDQRTQQRLSALIDQGQQVAVPFNRQKLKPGDEHIFRVGVLNILDAAQSTFSVSITPSTAVDNEGNEVAVDIDDWFSYVNEPFSLDKGKHSTLNVLLTVPNVPAGTYIFNVRVNTQNGEIYDTIRKITITVV